MDLFLELEDELGADLSALVREMPSPLAECTPLSRRGPSAHATAFRFAFVDGRLCKGAVLQTAAQAEMVAHVARPLTQYGIPAILGQRGAALLAQWIDGESLAIGDCSLAVLRQCGALQSLVHSVPIAMDGRGESAGRLRRRGRNLHRDLDALIQSALLDPSHADGAAEIARQFMPTTCAIGPILGDFCAENTVRTQAGALFIVDIETLAIDACDYDLARTWYRWPMNPAEREAYWDGYRSHRDPAAFIAHFPFWATAALVDGATFRSHFRPTTTSVPLRRLCDLVEQLAHGATPATVMAR